MQYVVLGNAIGKGRWGRVVPPDQDTNTLVLDKLWKEIGWPKDTRRRRPGFLRIAI